MYVDRFRDRRMNHVDQGVVTNGGRPRLLKLAGLLLRNDEWVEDAVEQALREVPERADDPAAVPALIGMLRARIAEQLRRRNAAVGSDARGEDDGSDTIDELYSADGRRLAPVADWSDVELASSSREFAAALEACLEELPPTLAQVLLLREWMRYDTGAICRMLGLSSGECRERLLHARLRLSVGMQRRWPAAQAT